MGSSRIVTTSELDEMVALLYSEKVKTREEGVKTLTTILDSAGGLMVLDQQTSLLKSTCRITAWSWPGVADALCQCIDTEVGGSKKRGPKPSLAKAMRNLVQKAEDPSRPGKSLVLLRKVNTLAKHILYVLQEVPSFVSDYSSVLRQVILNVEYRLRLNKKVYNALVEHFFEKVKATTSSNGLEPKEEAFQSATTLHALLQNPPGDLPDVLKRHVVDNFVEIFSHIRDEGRLAKKLLAALNVFLVSNGLNISDLVINLHTSIRKFLFRSWLTTRDRELKDALVLYVRVQLQLRYILVSEDLEVLEELLELVEKELDQTGIASMGMYREERIGSVTRSMRGFLELAAAVIFEAHKRKHPCRDRVKRRRANSVHATVKDRLSTGKYFWIGAVSMLIRRRGSLLQKPVLNSWLDGLVSGFESVLADAANSRSTEILLWTLRCLQEFAILWPTITPSTRCVVLSAEDEKVWQFIWRSLLHWLPLLSNVPIVADSSFKLLGVVVAQNLVLVCNVPQDIWNTQSFSETPSGDVLYFVATLFSSPGYQALAKDDMMLRSKLINLTLSSLDIQGTTRSKAAGEFMVSPRLLSSSLLALSVGCIPESVNCLNGCNFASVPILDELDCCLEPELQDRADELELTALDRSEDVLAASGDATVHEVPLRSTLRISPLPRSKCGPLLQQASLKLIEKTEAASNLNISQLFHMAATVSACLDGVEQILHKRGQEQQDWCPGGRLWKALASIVHLSLSLIDSPGSNLHSNAKALNLRVQQLPSVLVGLQQLTASGRGALVQADGLCRGPDDSSCAEPLLDVLLCKLCQTLQGDNEVLGSLSTHCSSNLQWTESESKPKMLDADLDAMADSPLLSADRLDYMPGNVKALSVLSAADRATCSQSSWKHTIVQMVKAIGLVSPASAIENLIILAQGEKNSKMRLEIVRQLCTLITRSTLSSFPAVVEIMQDISQESVDLEKSKYDLLDAINVLLTNLLRPTPGCRKSREEAFSLPEQASSSISNLVDQVADSGIALWPTRLVLGKVLANFVLLDASTAQSQIDKLLGLTNDPEFQVRLKMSKLITVLFESWEGHWDLLQDLSINLGLPTIEACQNDLSSGLDLAAEVSALPSSAETSLVTLGHVASASSKVETEVVFRICAYAAFSPRHRPLTLAVLDRLAKKLKYTTRLEYMERLFGGILHRWVVSRVRLASALEVKSLLAGDLETREFFQQCCPWLLSPLLLEGHINEIEWMANVIGETVPALLKQHFPPTFAALLLSHLDGDGDEPGKAQAASVLQGSMLRVMEATEDERDTLIQKNMVSIVHWLFRFCNREDSTQKPYFSKGALASSAHALVDGFLEQGQFSEDGTIVDKMQVFRPGRVFAFLLQIHQDIQVASNPGHRLYPLSSLAALMDIVNQRCLVPSTFRYLVHIIMQSIGVWEIQEHCCLLLGKLLDKVDARPDEEVISILGDHLQLIVSKLVSCYAEAGLVQPDSPATGFEVSTCKDISDRKILLLSLLHRITIDAHRGLSKYIEELDRFPDLAAFEQMRYLQAGSNFAAEFVQFVKRAPNLSPQLRTTGLQSLCQQLPARREELYNSTPEGASQEKTLSCKAEVVAAVWDLLHMCDEQDDFDIREVAAEFLAVINIGDTEAPRSLLPFVHEGCREVSIDAEFGFHDVTVKMILVQLHLYMSDVEVSIIELAHRAIKGILATEKGHRVFQSLDLQTKSYLKVCSCGVNRALVEDLLNTALSNRENQPMSLQETKLWDTSGSTYGLWVCKLVHALLEHTEDTIAKLCQEIVLQKTALAELMFPHVLGLLAGKFDPELRVCRLLSEQVAKFVFCEANKCTRSIQLFLEAMNCLRVEFVARRMKQSPSTNNSGKGDKGVSSSGKSSRRSVNLGGNTESSSLACEVVSGWAKVYWLKIDYLKTAQAAQQCAAYYTSALYIEHWCEETHGSMTLGEPDFSTDDSLPLHVELLLTVCMKTSEPDSIYGVVRSHKLLSQLLVHENEGNWSKAVEGYDLLLRSSKAGSVGAATGESREWKYYKGLMRSLQQMGCSHVLGMYYLGLGQQKPAFLDHSEFKELQFEAAWRAGKWDMDYLTTERSIGCPNPRRTANYHANLYSCLRSLVEGDEDWFSMHLKQSRQDIVSSIAHVSMESSQNVNPNIVRLKVLDCLSRAWEMRWRRALPSQDVHGAGRLSLEQAVAGPFVPSDDEVGKLEQACQENLKQLRMHYNLAEHMAAFFKTLYGVVSRRDRVPRHLLEFARLSRKAKRLNHATISLHELKIISNEWMNEANVEQLSTSVSSTISAGKIEEAKILWAQGHQELALKLAKFVCKDSSTSLDLAAIICLTGKWLSETRSESSRDILDKYLKKAVELVGGGENQATRPAHELWTTRQCRTHFHLAHYTDALYRSYEDRLSSTEWKSALRLRQHKARELEKLRKRLKAASKGEQQQYMMRFTDLQKQLALDSEEAQHLQDDRNYFLSSCLRSYTTCLTTGNKYDLRVVFRLVSLWFNLPSSAEVVHQMQNATHMVKSHKFLPLVYQIASRMGNNNREAPGSVTFQSALTFLVEKMVVDHPYHSLYQLLALANGDRVKAQQRSRSAFIVDMDKKQAAENLLLKMQAVHPTLLPQMRKMIEMYIKLAELETKKEHVNKKIAVPRDVRSVRQLELIPVITAHVPVDTSCSYSPGTYPSFQGFSDGIQVMHGVNAPKVIECLGSDGRKYRQLAKSGDDDLRQDAVMEQLFGLVNTLLQDHPETRKRRLSIRTYKVVPFTPSAGVLEWVNGTIPLGEYLLGGGSRTGGAHGRYGEDDWSFGVCREKMTTEKDKRKTFEKVCERFRPVMHHFFIEKFSQPVEWFEKRLAYTRSVAASSMVGYIVGLGDRHSMNILLDQASAEVVHIDLGVAFEQGLMLKTPERVPFRLTRDLVDGMGVSGVEGVFRRCCEATLSVMRMNKEALLTIIEVFIHDPLYRWALSPLKALQRQQDKSDDDEDSYMEDDDDLAAEIEGNKDAARALLRVKQKLDGYEGEMRSLEGQVQQLIQDSQDPERLCQMFPGWGAWL